MQPQTVIQNGRGKKNTLLCKCGEGFWRCPIYKVKQESKIARLVMEDKLIKKLKPDLNRDQRNLLHLTTIPTQTPE